MTGPLAFLAIGTAAALAASAAPLALGGRRAPLVLINESRSLPKGLYVRAADGPPRVGQIVALRQPPAARPYLAALGMPPTTVLLKRVAATGGARVCRTSAALVVPGRRVSALSRDRRGVALLSWRGCRTLAADEFVVLGDTPTSFDSRYFGPVPSSALAGVYKELVRW